MSTSLRLWALLSAFIWAGSASLSRAEPQLRAVDPGVRPGVTNAGSAMGGANAKDFAVARSSFNRVHSISGDIEAGQGLGPRFNGTSCGACHAYPVAGGSSPPKNPQLLMATAHGARNIIPYFLRENGPVITVRVQRAVGTTAPGEVLPLFTVNGRSDAHGCAVSPPDFSNPANLSFRIPAPVFGAGLIDNVDNAAILANRERDHAAKQELGIRGEPHITADGSVGKFGWKAQHATLTEFAEDAYETEMGVRSPNSDYRHESLTGPCYGLYDAAYDDPYFSPFYENEEPPVFFFVEFMRFLRPPEAVAEFPGATTESIRHGREVFDRVGCALCHAPALRTSRASDFPALNDRDALLFSDLCLHHMGPKLADGIVQGHAGSDQFRTAPLWGVGQRLFFLHDGRTTDLLMAILEHASEREGNRSEANGVIDRFNRLDTAEQQDLLNFLRSL